MYFYTYLHEIALIGTALRAAVIDDLERTVLAGNNIVDERRQRLGNEQLHELLGGVIRGDFAGKHGERLHDHLLLLAAVEILAITLDKSHCVDCGLHQQGRGDLLVHHHLFDGIVNILDEFAGANVGHC